MGGVFDRFHFRVDSLAESIRDAMGEIVEDHGKAVDVHRDVAGLNGGKWCLYLPQNFYGGPGYNWEKRASMFVHSLAHGSLGRNLFVAERFTEIVVTAKLFDGYEITLGLGQKAAVAPDDIGGGYLIVCGSHLRQGPGRIKALGMDTVCMLKDTKNVKYELKGWPLTLKELYNNVRKRRGRAKVLAEVLVTVGQDEHGVPVPAKVVFVRDRNSKKWLALLSTDTTLTAEEIVKLYGFRWDIEVFFRMAKSFLSLAKEFQSRSFDALVAQATLVCCRYIMPELVKRTNADPRTLGNLFHAVSDELRQISFTETLALLLKLLEETLNCVVELCKEQVQQLIERFVGTLPGAFRERLLLLAPERG